MKIELEALVAKLPASTPKKFDLEALTAPEPAA
jgi:hypothetical protein